MQLQLFSLREVSEFQANGPDVNLRNMDLYFFLLTTITLSLTAQKPLSDWPQKPHLNLQY